ncbi:hypothetical protein J3E68DRAFT_397818 [Trichoderma sp. SZMC 28012]
MKAFASDAASQGKDICELHLSVLRDKMPATTRISEYTTHVRSTRTSLCVLFRTCYSTHTLSGQAVDPFGPRADGDDVFCCQSRLLDRTMLGDAQHLAAACMLHLPVRGSSCPLTLSVSHRLRPAPLQDGAV